MAETTDRVATKERFLAMAADYEARAEIAKGAEPDTGNETVEPSLGEPITDVTNPSLGETLRVKPVRQIATGLKETMLIQRRPVGRPRRPTVL
jgi:hypothetical protein